jgi:hypothetical protein
VEKKTAIRSQGRAVCDCVSRVDSLLWIALRVADSHLGPRRYRNRGLGHWVGRNTAGLSRGETTPTRAYLVHDLLVDLGRGWSDRLHRHLAADRAALTERAPRMAGECSERGGCWFVTQPTF